MPANTPTPDGHHTIQHVSGNVAGRDIVIAGRDAVFTNYWVGLRILKPKPVNPDTYIPLKRFVAPPGYETLREALHRSAFRGENAHVLFVLAPEAYGRKSAAIRLLATRVSPERIYELLPDWDTPDVACLPKERGAGYLLNLRGIRQSLPLDFLNDLVEFAQELSKLESYLAITATPSVCAAIREIGHDPRVAIQEIERPSGIQIVKKFLQAEGGLEERIYWLDDPNSVFHNLLPDNSAPTDAVRLAVIMSKAKGPQDKEALDEYQDWKGYLDRLFGPADDDKDEDKVEKRAKAIAIAFLDKTPASVILDSADRLLSMEEINWQMPKGGPLALPDAEHRLRSIHATFDEETGIASLVHESQGPAILRRVWTRHVQLTRVLTKWLEDISQGAAKDHLDTLARSLMTLAETVGVGPIFSLAEGWLKNHNKRHVQLVADLISGLAVHPTLGSEARSEIAKWAKGRQYAPRQKAAARACAGSFGIMYTSMALTRIRYVLESTEDGDVEREAIDALRSLAVRETLAPLVVDAVVKWLDNSDKMSNVFFEIFGRLAPSHSTSPLEVALSLPRDAVEELLKRLIDAWNHILERGEDLQEAEQALLAWRMGAEEGRLPMDLVVQTFLKLAPGITNPPIKSVIMRDGPFKDALIPALVAELTGPTHVNGA